ncbi:hypothetical protein [Streptomyces iranensis]|uniref:Uncharacterized protein n=1 Tax=Streptomyces iranensis TaxID=576784 RepID=A0A060ZJ74_9ACTN|nr:hypothetical protein [Streptomyces iranensis]MBP2063081.1 hypothetical protein [Streptomyces iranensis]CDR05824.1 predicted protein [Streptomyces iranensis]
MRLIILGADYPQHCRPHDLTAACRTPGAACETGEALLAPYNTASREGGRAAP